MLLLLLLAGLAWMRTAAGSAARWLRRPSSCASSARAKALRAEQLLRERVPAWTVAAQTWRACTNAWSGSHVMLAGWARDG